MNPEALLLAYAEAHGMIVTNTGGGCTALHFNIDREHYILITNDNLSHPESLWEPDCCACMWDLEDNFMPIVKSGTAKDCIDIAARIG